MADVNALYPTPPQPTQGILSGDPLKAIGLIGQLNQNALFQQTFGARKAIGEAYQEAIRPDGSIDTQKLMRGIQSRPDAGFMAGEAAAGALTRQGQQLSNTGQDISNTTAAFDQYAKQSDFAAKGFAALLQKGNKLTPEDINNWAVTMARNTDPRAVPASVIAQMKNRILKDPDGILSGVNSVANMVMGPSGAASRIEGPPDQSGAATSVPVGAIGYTNGGAAPGSITRTLPPGESGILEESAKRASALQATGASTAQYHADLENLKLDSKILDSVGGPTVESEKKLNQFSQRLAGVGVTMSKEQLRALESFDKIANQISLNQAATMAGTDAGRMMSVGANPNSSMSLYGRNGVIDMLQGNQDFVDVTRKAWLKARSDGAPANSHDTFINKFSETADPRVFQFNRLNRENQQKFLSQMDPDEIPDFERKYKDAISRKWVKPLKGQTNG